MKKTLKLFSMLIAVLLIGIINVKADTLQSKIDAADGKTTIKLDTNYTENITIGNGKEIVLDLSGNSLTGKITVNGGNLTVDDSATGGKINLGNNNIPVTNGSFTLEKGDIESTGNYGIYGLYGSTITINGGSILTHAYACLGSNNTTGNATFVINDGTLTADWQTVYIANPIGLTINGGTLNGGIAARMGIININGGTINASNKSEGFIDMKDYYWKSGYAETPDAIYAMVGSYATTSEEGNDLNINITGGTINVANGEGSALALYDIGKVAQNATLRISGYAVLKTNATDRNAVDVLNLSDIGVTSIKSGYNNPEYVGKITGNISGGTFSNDQDDYLEINYITYTKDNKNFVVLPAKTYSLPEDAYFVEKGKTINFIPIIEDIYKEYLRIHIADSDIAVYSNGVITGIDLGTTYLIAGLGRTGDSRPLTVYEIAPVTTENSEENTINNTVNELAKDLIAKALDGQNVTGLSEETIGNIIDAVTHGMPIETEVKIDEVSKDTISSEVLEKVEKAVAENDGIIAAFLNIDVLLKADGDDLGNVTKLPDEIELSVDIDKKFAEIPDGVTRTFFVIRLHDGEDPEIIPATLKDGKLVFKTDRFSNYILAYKDTEETKKDEIQTTEPAKATPTPEKTNEDTKEPNPKSGDTIGMYLGIMTLSSLGIIGLRKKKHN